MTSLDPSSLDAAAPPSTGPLSTPALSLTQETPRTAAERSRLARKTAIAAGIGTLIEYYDFAVYGYVSVVIAPLFFPTGGTATSVLIALAVFGTAYLVRPLGAIAFGYLGDRRGRRYALLASVTCMGLASTCMGLLPTHQMVGVWAGVLMVALRFVQGISAGGEVGGAATIIAEYSPPEKRALYGSATGFGANGGFAVAAALVGTMFALTTDAQMSSWGWRIPFLMAFPMSMIALWMRRGIPTDVIDAHDPDERSPISSVVTSERINLLVAVLLCLAVTGSSYIGITYISIHMTTVVGYDKSSVYWITALVVLLTVLLMPWIGKIADRVGFLNVAAAGLLGHAILAIPAFLAINSGNLVIASILYFAYFANIAPTQVALFTLLPGFFTKKSRVTGVAICFNLGTILGGGFAPLIASWLVGVTGTNIAPVFYILPVSILGLIVIRYVRNGREHLVANISSTPER